MLPRTSINPRILRAVFLPSVALLPVTTRSFSNRQILRCARGFSGVRAGQGGPLIGAPHGRSQWSDHPLVSKDSRNGLKRTRMRQITSVRRLSSSLLPASVHSITTNLFGTGALSGILPACTAARIYLLRSSTYVLSSLLILSHFGLLLEKRTHLGKALSAPLATMALALTMANVGLIPFASPVYQVVNKTLVSLAVPLLLFDSDIKRIIKDTGSLFVAFIVGAISTVIGTVVAYPLIPLTSLGSEDGWKIAAALASRHIGGAINFVACCETLSVSSSSVSAALAADNLVVALYFAFLFGLSKPGENSKNGTGPMSSANSEETTSSVGHIASGASSTVKREILPSELTLSGTSSISVHSISLSLAISSSLVVLGDIITKRLLPAGTSSLSVSSLLTVAGASIFPKSFAELRTSGTTLGIIFVQMFFAASGAAGSIHEVMRKAPSLFAFSALQLATHFVALLGIGKYVCGLKARELYLASNANVGGPTTAAAMAQAKEWKTLVLPALLIGILGYATATPIGLALGTVLQRLPLSRG